MASACGKEPMHAMARATDACHGHGQEHSGRPSWRSNPELGPIPNPIIELTLRCSSAAVTSAFLACAFSSASSAARLHPQRGHISAHSTHTQGSVWGPRGCPWHRARGLEGLCEGPVLAPIWQRAAPSLCLRRLSCQGSDLLLILFFKQAIHAYATVTPGERLDKGRVG